MTPKNIVGVTILAAFLIIGVVLLANWMNPPESIDRPEIETFFLVCYVFGIAWLTALLAFVSESTDADWDNGVVLLIIALWPLLLFLSVPVGVIWLFWKFFEWLGS